MLCSRRRTFGKPVKVPALNRLFGLVAPRLEPRQHRWAGLLHLPLPGVKVPDGGIVLVAAAAQEQTSGVQQVNGAMGQLTAAMQQNAAASEQLAATAGGLSDQSGQLRAMVGFFKLG